MPTTLPPDPYRALGLDPTADIGTIKTIYRKLVLTCHPDKFPDPLMKAEKQAEFQRVQQAYEILTDEGKRQEYDLQIKLRKLREARYQHQQPRTPSKTPSETRFNVRTPEKSSTPSKSPTPPKYSNSKPVFGKPFSSAPTHGWHRDGPPRVQVYYEEEEPKARRTSSYEKPKREDSRERRTRMAQEMDDREARRQQKLMRERELKESVQRSRERDRIRQAMEEEEKNARVKAYLERDAKARAAADAKKKQRDRERSERERQRQQEADDKARARSKPYVEHSSYSEDDDVDHRRGRSKKSSKKQSENVARDRSFYKQPDRSSSTPDGAHGSMKSQRDFHTAYAKQYQKERQYDAKHGGGAESPTYPAPYPDSTSKRNPVPPKERAYDGVNKAEKGERITVDEPIPTRDRPEVVSEPPPRLHKSNSTPPGRIPQTKTATPPLTPRVPFNRSYTMPPEYEYQSRYDAERRRPSRRHAAYSEFEYVDENFHHDPHVRIATYHIVGGDMGSPRVVEAKHHDMYASFSHVKMAPCYGPEHVATSRRYEDAEVATADYAHVQPSYADYPGLVS